MTSFALTRHTVVYMDGYYDVMIVLGFQMLQDLNDVTTQQSVQVTSMWCHAIHAIKLPYKNDVIGYVTGTGRPGEGRPAVQRCSCLPPVAKRTVLRNRLITRWFHYSLSPALWTRRISSPHRSSDPPRAVTSGHCAYSTLRPLRWSVYWRLRYGRRYGYWTCRPAQSVKPPAYSCARESSGKPAHWERRICCCTYWGGIWRQFCPRRLPRQHAFCRMRTRGRVPRVWWSSERGCTCHRHYRRNLTGRRRPAGGNILKYNKR